MQLILERVLDSATLSALTDVLSSNAAFEDGARTAGRVAKPVKVNEQAERGAEVEGALRLIEQRLSAHPLFRDATLPLRFAKLMFNRYSEGMHYGAHVDDAFINDARTDVSFTVFLSDPEAYDGGELVLCHPDGEERVKCRKGDVFLYPSSAIHYVAEVRSGVRLAAVGWLQSRVREAVQRECLFEMQRTIQDLSQDPSAQPQTLRLLKVKNQLMRLWAD